MRDIVELGVSCVMPVLDHAAPGCTTFPPVIWIRPFSNDALRRPVEMLKALRDLGSGLANRVYDFSSYFAMLRASFTLTSIVGVQLDRRYCERPEGGQNGSVE